MILGSVVDALIQFAYIFTVIEGRAFGCACPVWSVWVRKSMMDNLQFGVDAELNHKFNVMRAISGNGAVADGVVPGLGTFFSIDPEGDFDGTYDTGGGAVLTLKCTVRRAPRWMALHAPLGGVDLGRSSVFGVVCKTSAPRAVTFRVALRSAAPGGAVDAFFPKHVVAYAEESTHVDILKLAGRDDVPATADWRDLILFFGPETSALTVQDFRVFIV